jgi:formylglycine-generating enzyme required for sulfatase activity/predicted 2-oxoglutarate/Fe(II)-dependent dioxygenase YbiX
MAEQNAAAELPPVNESVIRSALVLRDAIARAPSVLSSLGHFQVFLRQDEIKARRDFLDDPDVPPGMHSDILSAIGESLQWDCHELAASFVSQPSLPTEDDARLVSITHTNCAMQLPINAVSADSISQIYYAATPAAFGDMKAMETRFDPLVRSGRELDATQFSVPETLRAWVERTWAEHFEPKNVRAEPYKINLYGPGDRFAPHRDTPQKNLVGTFLLALSGWGPPCDGGGLVVHDTGGDHRWDGASGWAAFVPYLVHEVEPIVAGARATIAFKVFSTTDEPVGDQAEWQEDQLREIAERIAWCCYNRPSPYTSSGKVGVLLSFAYSLNSTALCGRDLFVYRAMQQIGEVESVPVAVHVRATADTADTGHWFASADVYSLSQENLSLLTRAEKRMKTPKGGDEPIPFIAMGEGYKVYSNNRRAVEWAGNYAEPANVDTLYVHRALILTTSAGAERGKMRCTGYNLDKVDLSSHDLRSEDFTQTSFRDATLARADLRNADLSWANLEKADLSGATLCGANLEDANLDHAILTDGQWDYETAWPDGFDPISHGAATPVELTRVRPGSDWPDPPGTIANSLGMKFVPIPAGEFLMGTPGDEGEEYQHCVRITKPFLLGMHQVTQAEYEQVTGENPSLFRGPNLPVEHIPWQAAARFCELLSALPDEQHAGRRYRLPTEAEWEYACRAGTVTMFNTGDALHADHAHFASVNRSVAKQTMPVGSFPPNSWGLFDMHGNVWEWTNDWFSADYYRDSPIDDPLGPASGTHHTLRGGCSSMEARWCASSVRGEAAAVDGPETETLAEIAFMGDLGIRVVCEIAT